MSQTAHSLRQDTRRLLATGAAIFGTGAAAAVLMLTVFGGITKQGPHTNSGWLALIVALGCVPTGVMTLLLAASKAIGDLRAVSAASED